MLASDQVQFSLLYRKHEREGLLAKAKELGVSVIAYSPLAQGMLTGQSLPLLPRQPSSSMPVRHALCFFVFASPLLVLLLCQACMLPGPSLLLLFCQCSVFYPRSAYFPLAQGMLTRCPLFLLFNQVLLLLLLCQICKLVG